MLPSKVAVQESHQTADNPIIKYLHGTEIDGEGKIENAQQVRNCSLRITTTTKNIRF